jgi:hypothetical protein
VALVRTDVSEECIVSVNVRGLLVTAKIVPNSPIIVTLMMEVILSSGKLLLTIAKRRHIPEDGILHEAEMCYTNDEPNISSNNVDCAYRR